jgi:hypothetical protein
MTEGAVKFALHRLRQRYRQLLREEIANTVATPVEVDEEMHPLFASYETPFFLRKGEKPDLIKLNLVLKRAGKVWVKDVELLKGPLPLGQQ